MASVFAGLVLALFLVLPGLARAEQDEVTLGAEVGLLLPDFSPKSATEIAVATWNVGILLSYGVLDDLSLTAEFLFSMFDATSTGYTLRHDQLEYTGSLDFSSRVYHPRVGARYKLFSGYNLAPYVEAHLGWAWSTYHKAKLLNEDGLDYGLGLGDWGESAFTVSVGASVDYRLANAVFLGLGFSYTYAIGGGLLRQFFSIPLQVSYYW
jgi:hypothetical protein